MIWKPVVGHEQYYMVSNTGLVKSLGGRSGSGKKILSSHPHEFGYPMIDLTKDKKRRTYSIHRLVAEAFIPNPYNLPQVNHIDFDPTNNHVTNLEWCTALQNVRHTVRAGRKASVGKGESNWNAKLTADSVRKIRKLHRTVFIRDIAALFNVSSRTIDYIVAGKRWGHVE